MRRITPILAAAAAVSALGAGGIAVASGAATGSAGAPAAGCATSVQGLRFARAPRAKTGRLSWQAPANARGRLSYRVYKNGRRIAQTNKRSMRVAVRMNHRYRFSVAVVRGGHVQGRRCRATQAVAIRALPPSTPKHLKTRVVGGKVRLTWHRSRPGDRPLKGYRVLRDGQTVRQVRGTRLTVAVNLQRPTQLGVAAIDAAGRMSAPATTTVGRAPARKAPAAPEGLRAVSVTETDVTLAWNASAPGSGRIAGYRVIRDGATVGQVAGTQITVPRLNTAQAYTFTVVAVDTSGLQSAPSRALTVSTNPPPPTTGSLHAFLLASTGSSFQDFQAHYRQIGAVHATYFECNRSTAGIIGADNPQITRFAKLRQVEIYARFDCQSAGTLSRILNEPATRQAWLDGIVSIAVQYGYDGINLDFESGAATDRAALSSFVAELAARLHGVGKKLAVDVAAKTADNPTHPRSGFYDYNAIAASADKVFVMAWGIHWATSAPGPIADMRWVQNVVSYVNTLPNRDRYIMGAPLYGMDWPNGGGLSNPATALSWPDVVSLSQRVGAAGVYDPTAHEVTFKYTDAAGVPHEVWALNGAAVAERMRLFRANGYGIGVWRLGQEDQALWSDPVLAG